ncbi:hypothetical protein VPHD148_0015 [Vibrio phage D148]
MIETPKVNDQSLIYMYGLSDFWSDIFGDTQLVEAVLASSTISMAEVYSYFLQRAAGISLTDISERYSTRIKLFLIDESSALDDDNTTFPLDGEFESSPKISNRPILPSQTLENDVHYEILDGSIRFAKPISEYKFAARNTTAGTAEYALWLCDVEVDENWIDNSFGRLVGFTEEDAIFNYKSFLEGVYYLYSNGPNIAYIERGINLAMGMPYARASEVILDIRQDAVTGNWLVFTDTMAYELPYGYRPELEVEDSLTENEVLTTWVEIKDWVRNGDWWYDVYLPREVLGSLSDPIELGRCTPGSTGDKMMQNFLKHHMFEVLITQPNGDEQSFNTARNLVLRAKPEYTYPIFVWKAPIEDEIIDIQDDLTLSLTLDLEDTCVSPPSIRFMDRSVHPIPPNPDDPYDPSEPWDPTNPKLPEDDYGHDPFIRGKHWYNRNQGSMYAATLLGYGDWPGNAGWAPEFSSVSNNYLSYMDSLMRTRGDAISPINRSTVTRGWRGHVQNRDIAGNPLDDTPDGIEWSVPGNKTIPGSPNGEKINERDLTPLYMLSTSELVEKIRTIKPRFQLLKDDFRFVLTGLNLASLYETFMIRNAAVLDTDMDEDYNFTFTEGGLDIKFSPFANQAYVPKRSEMYREDGSPITDGKLFVSKNTNAVWTVQWVRDSITSAPTLYPIEDQDHLQAIEVYDQNDIGNEYAHIDKYINKGQQNILSPVVLGSEGTLLLTEGGYFKPSYTYDVADDGINVTLVSSTESDGNASWIPYSYDERILLAGGDTYQIPEELVSKEDVFLAYSPVSSSYEFLSDYTLTSTPGSGSIITLGSSLPTGGDLIVVYTDRGVAPEEDLFIPAGSEYTIQPGYTVKILTEGKVLPDRDYLINDTTLTFNEVPTADFIVRYYPTLSYTLQSSFNRSSVQRNEARMLMDRGRPNGEYDDFWDGTDDSGTPNVYMNRSGKAWLEVPELGDTPVYADSVHVVRRLR